MHKHRTAVVVVLLASSIGAVASEHDKEALTPAIPSDDAWHYSLAVPGWLVGVEGDVGVDGLETHVDIGPDDVIRSIDALALLRGEASKGRFGVMGEVLYLDLSDSVGSDSLVEKLDLELEQLIGELAVRGRIIESPRGSLDIYSGVRYVNLHEGLTLQPNNAEIGATCERLADTVGERIRARVEESLSEKDFRNEIGMAISDEITDRLTELRGDRPSLPIAPLARRTPGRVGEIIRDLVQSKTEMIKDAVRAELEAAAAAARAAIAQKTAAARAKAEAAAAELRVAVDRQVTVAKKELSTEIGDTLRDKLDTRISRTDDWWDPFIGLRARYELSSAWYLTAKGDIGGFGVGSDFAWQAEGALGYQIRRNIFAEVGYRALGMDYDHDGFLYDTVTHGAQVTIGITF